MTLLYAVLSILSLLISFQFQCGLKIRKQALCVIIAFVPSPTQKKKFPYRKGYYAWNKHTRIKFKLNSSLTLTNFSISSYNFFRFIFMERLCIIIVHALPKHLHY